MKKLIKRFKIGGGTSPATPYNRGLSNPNTIKTIPEITVNGIDRRIRFDRRSKDLGNGYSITSDALYDYYGGGNRYLGDLAYILGGRTIYQTPKGNDTVFWKKETDYIDNGSGFMGIGKPEKGAKQNFYNVIRKNKFIAGEPQEKAALQRAKRGYAEGGEIVKAEGGDKFLENLEPPSRGLWGEMKTNMLQGGEQLSKLFGSLPFQIALGGNAVGFAGMFGPEVRIFKDIRNMLGSSKGFKLGIRKFSRNLNAKKGDTSYRWTKTSGNLREGGFLDRIYPGMGKGPQRIVSKATRAEGSGYSAQPILNNNPIYQKASSPAQTSMQRSTNHMRSVPLEQTVSRHVFTRNRLIDEARDPWNYIFGHKNGGSLKGIPFHQLGGPLTNVDTRSDTTRQGLHEGTIPYGAGKDAAGQGPSYLLTANVVSNPNIQIGAPELLPGKYPNIRSLYGSRHGAEVALQEATKMLKKLKMKPIMGKNGTQYVQTAEGKVKPLLDFGAEAVEARIARTEALQGTEHYMLSYMRRAELNALMIKERFSNNAHWEPYTVTDPATNLQATKGSINKVRGKVSNRNAITANHFK